MDPVAKDDLAAAVSVSTKASFDPQFWTEYGLKELLKKQTLLKLYYIQNPAAKGTQEVHQRLLKHEHSGAIMVSLRTVYQGAGELPGVQ